MLTLLEYRDRKPARIVAPIAIAREHAAAARERRNERIDRELAMSGEKESGAMRNEERPGNWERLVAKTVMLSTSPAQEPVMSVDRTFAPDRSTTPGTDWLRKIHEELRALRQSLTSPATRALSND